MEQRIQRTICWWNPHVSY